MYDGGKIITGLIVFLAIATSPVWFQLAKGTAPAAPQPKIITEAKSCVASKEYMRVLHMDMLNQWRDSVVRNGERTYIATDGKEYDMSLSRTCMSCHSNKVDFCDSCHNYAGVTPYCWDCHVEPREKP